MTTRGPQIITAISYSANPPTEYVREMSVAGLYDALDTWISGKARFGRGRAPGALTFKRQANQQIGRIKRELQRRLLPLNRDNYVQRQRIGSDATRRCTFGPEVQ